ncbi:MAG: alpha-galactosidase, partial [Pseudomonadota bacterium]
MTARITRLDSPAQTMVLASQDDRLPVVVYWGACLPLEIELQPLVALNQRPLGHGMLDEPAALSTCPEHGRGFPGYAGLQGHRAGGRAWTGQFQLERWTARDNGLSVEALDAPAGLRLVQEISLNSA